MCVKGKAELVNSNPLTWRFMKVNSVKQEGHADSEVGATAQVSATALMAGGSPPTVGGRMSLGDEPHMMILSKARQELAGEHCGDSFGVCTADSSESSVCSPEFPDSWRPEGRKFF